MSTILSSSMHRQQFILFRLHCVSEANIFVIRASLCKTWWTKTWLNLLKCLSEKVNLNNNTLFNKINRTITVVIRIMGRTIIAAVVLIVWILQSMSLLGAGGSPFLLHFPFDSRGRPVATVVLFSPVTPIEERDTPAPLTMGLVSGLSLTKKKAAARCVCRLCADVACWNNPACFPDTKVDA